MAVLLLALDVFACGAAVLRVLPGVLVAGRHKKGESEEEVPVIVMGYVKKKNDPDKGLWRTLEAYKRRHGVASNITKDRYVFRGNAFHTVQATGSYNLVRQTSTTLCMTRAHTTADDLPRFGDVESTHVIAFRCLHPPRPDGSARTK